MRAAGVWEDSRDAYLHEVLIRRRGTPAALAVLLHGTFQQLFLDGAIDFMVRTDCGCARLAATVPNCRHGPMPPPHACPWSTATPLHA